MQNNIPNHTEDNSLHLRDQLFKYLIHWKWFLLSLLAFLILAKLYLRYSVPEYIAQTTILIKDEDSGGIASELSAFKDLGLLSGAKNDIDDEIEILKSRTLAEKTVKAGEFNISYISEGRIKSSDAYGTSFFNIDFKRKNEDFYAKDTIININVLSFQKFELFNQENNSLGVYKFGQLIKSKVLGEYVVNRKALLVEDDKALEEVKGKTIVRLSSLKNATDSFRSRINVVPLNKLTNVLEISCIDQVSERAIDFLNLLVTIYNNDAITDKNMISEKTAQFINERLGIITKELDGVEKDVESYKKNNKITDLPTEAELYLQNASEFKKSSLAVETQSRIVDMMIDFMHTNKGSDIIPANIVPEDNASAALIADYNGLVVERDRILKSSTTENPIVVRMNDKIKALQSSIGESLKRLKSTLAVKSTDVNRQSNILGGRISQIPKLEREYRGIFRQQQIKEELYLYLFKKREETAITLAGTAPISKVVDSAYSSDAPVSPKKSLFYMIAFIMGIFVPAAVIYLRNLLDTKVKTRYDVERLGIPFIGDVPHSDSHNEIIQSNSRTSSAEAIRIIRTNLEFILNSVEKNRAKTIFMTSTLPKEGKTFIAVNLAATIAISGKKVLLIGMDIRNPKLDEYIKLPSRGLTNYLSSSDAVLKDFIVRQKDYEHFDILPAGVIPPNPAELLMSQKVEAMFEQFKTEYDYIVVDTAPVSLVTDTLLISKNADTFIYVVRANYLEKALLKTPEVLYREQKLPNMCVLLNDTDTINGYGYGYGQEVVKKPWYKKIFSFSFFG
ncbi:GumC family protein [Flavobacterium humi]|uniref:non-specific protein-tyrosine kinase n=1 Tax=Flavobacterium humi TaxID=2562683 RepID=A0A4Z0L4I6_9FLAO|nr:polysaccharide biosynthesis tyrosine autokinase [Flavobacterium humi]TGD57149.1 polysaccharide biosynthesis tyrosine autokinase [Flavobacterium humi]